MDLKTNLKRKGDLKNIITASLSTVSQECPYKKLLKDFVEVTRPSMKKESSHPVQHYIVTQGPPIAERPRRLTPEKYQAAKLAFQEMVNQGICQPSASQWASPLHLAPKSQVTGGFVAIIDVSTA